MSKHKISLKTVCLEKSYYGKRIGIYFEASSIYLKTNYTLVPTLQNNQVLEIGTLKELVKRTNESTNQPTLSRRILLKS